MSAVHIAVSISLTVVWFSSPAWSAYLESDFGSETPAGRIHPAPPPEPEVATLRLIARIRVGPSSDWAGLRIFPLCAAHAGSAHDIQVLDEALRRHLIEIAEKPQAEVPELLVRNLSERPVFLMAGEILVGGKQNRFIRHDILLQPRSAPIPVGVYCGEQHRWAGDSADFASPGLLAAPALRQKASARESQSAVWEEIAAQKEALKATSRSGDYAEIYASGAVQRQLDSLAERFAPVCSSETLGIVVACGDRIVGADLFGAPDLFSRLRHKIVRAYGLERLTLKSAPDGIITEQDVRAFLRSVQSARFERRYAVGIGDLYGIHGAVSGEALEWDGRVVHVSIFLDARPAPLSSQSNAPGPRDGVNRPPAMLRQ